MSKSTETLMLEYQKGDTLAFEVLYRQVSPKLYGYLLKKISREEADDVFQKTFLKIHRFRDQYDPQYRFEQWLFVIARSVLLDHLKQKKRGVMGMIDSTIETIEEIAAPVSQTADVAAYTSQGDAVSLNLLSEQQRQIVELRVSDDLSYREIANRLKQSETNVRQIFSRAIKKLRSSKKEKK